MKLDILSSINSKIMLFELKEIVSCHGNARMLPGDFRKNHKVRLLKLDCSFCEKRLKPERSPPRKPD